MTDTVESAAPVDSHASPLPRERAVVVLAIVVGVGFVVRLAWLLYALRTPVGSGDSAFYLAAANHLANGDGYRGPSGQSTALWPPGYPAVLAGALWIMRPFTTNAVHIGAGLNLVLGTSTVGMTGVLGRRLLGPWCGVAAAAVLALYPSTVMFTSAMLSETVFGFFEVAVLLVLLWRPWTGRGSVATLPSWQRCAVAGVLSGAAVLVRPPFVFSIVAVPLVVLWMVRPWREALLRTAAVVAGIAVIVLPWTIRNAVVMDAFVPVSLNTGYNLCMGHNPDAAGGFGTPDYCFHDLPTADTPQAEVQRDSITAERGMRWISSHLLEEPRLALLKIWTMFGGDRTGLAPVQSFGSDPWMAQRDVAIWSSVSTGYYFGVLALAMLGLLAWPLQGDRRHLVVVLMLAGVVIASMVFFGDERFKQPMVPLLAVAAVVPLRLLRPRCARVIDS